MVLSISEWMNFNLIMEYSYKKGGVRVRDMVWAPVEKGQRMGVQLHSMPELAWEWWNLYGQFPPSNYNHG